MLEEQLVWFGVVHLAFLDPGIVQKILQGAPPRAKRRPADPYGAVTGELGIAAKTAGRERLIHPDPITTNWPAARALFNLKRQE